ncbi:MAG: glycosyltransferase [Bacteroidales bacterium]|nr:glycosyltransferase [Bacteroidales bacterium]
MLRFDANDTVLVSPLGWGLGHASRLIPVINALLDKGCTVVIGADPHTIELLQPRFPNVECFVFKSVNVKFSKGKHQLFSLIRIAIKLLLLAKREQRELKRIIDTKSITAIISDNRYGLHAKGVKSVLVTHQLSPIFPKPFGWLQPLGKRYIKRQAQQFTECWIPDSENGFRLSGNLSDGEVATPNARFVGLMSRFSLLEPQKLQKGFDLVGVVSGPPPHRQAFEQELINIGQRLNLRTLIVQGLPQGKNAARTKGKVTLVPHLPDIQFAKELISAKYVICRSGYSTIMDLIALQCSAITVPTPGQTEQEYLANRIEGEKLFGYCHQDGLRDLTIDMLEGSALRINTRPGFQYFDLSVIQ